MVNRPSLYNNISACILKGRQVQIQSYQVTTNGSFAIIHALVRDPDAGVMAPTPAVGILEFSQGKISAETWLLLFLILLNREEAVVPEPAVTIRIQPDRMVSFDYPKADPGPRRLDHHVRPLFPGDPFWGLLPGI